MSLRYLPEHAEGALLALDLARKEAAHLRTPTVRCLPSPSTPLGFGS